MLKGETWVVDGKWECERDEKCRVPIHKAFNSLYTYTKRHLVICQQCLLESGQSRLQILLDLVNNE